MRTRFGDHLDDGMPLDRFQMLEFVLQGFVAGHRHGNAFHPVHLRIQNSHAKAAWFPLKSIAQAAR
jgi:hypothetical protein